MNAKDLPATPGKELKRSKYFVRMETLDQTLRREKPAIQARPQQ